MTTAIVAVTFDEMARLAEAVARSGLFGMKTPEQALALMAIAQAEGQHPALAARDYHVVQGRPVLKSDAMLARFQAAGGKMEMQEYTDSRVAAKFSHPQGGAVVIEWTTERAKVAGLAGRDNWKSYPRQMLRARVISEGVRTVFPGAVVGMMTPEEASDLPAESPEPKDVTPPKPATGIAALAARVADIAKAQEAPPADAPAPDNGERTDLLEPGYTYAQVADAFAKAVDRKTYKAAVDLASAWAENLPEDSPQREEMHAIRLAAHARIGGRTVEAAAR